MNIINHELNAEEKKIILNYFLFSKESSKTVMSDFALSTVKKYSNLYNHVKNLSDLRNASQNLDVVINLIWDKENNITAPMQCLGDRRYKDSYSKIKMFRFFNSDMSMKDINGETAIMKLAKNESNLRSINSILMVSQNTAEIYGYNFFDFNNDGDNVVMIALKTLNKKLIDLQFNGDAILECFEMLSGLQNAWMDKLQEVSEENTKNFLDLVKENIKLLVQYCEVEDKKPNKIFNYNYQYLLEEIDQVEKEVDSCLLNINLRNSLSQNVVENKRRKI